MNKKVIAMIVGKCAPDVGGTFQYVIALLDALAALDPARYSVRVFARNKRWRSISLERGVPAHCIRMFDYGKIRKTLGNIPFSSLRNVLLRGWNRLAPIRLSLEWHHVDVAIFPDQLPPLPLNSGIKQVCCVHDLMHRYESSFPEVGNPEEYAARELGYKAMVEQCAALLVDSEVGKQQVVESYAADPSKVFPLPYIVYEGLKKALPIRPSSLSEGIETKA